MKELKKKAKKTVEFEKIDYRAYHEQQGVYSDSGSYYKESSYSRYVKNEFVDMDDDILF
jgi:hypothetical protein